MVCSFGDKMISTTLVKDNTIMELIRIIPLHSLSYPSGFDYYFLQADLRKIYDCGNFIAVHHLESTIASIYAC